MSEELKPCPFCGGQAQVLQLGGDYYNDANRFVIQCKTCKVKTQNFYPSGRYHDPETLSRASAAWNRRASSWQPIETAPKDGTGVLLCGPSGEGIVSGFWHFDGWIFIPNLMLGGVAFWQPLPEPPEARP